MDQVETCLGAIDAASLGYTLTHEHILINMILDDRGVGVQVDYPLMSQEVGAFRKSSGRTIVDLSTAELSVGASPDPGSYLRPGSPDLISGCRDAGNAIALRNLARDTELNIVLGTGHYRDPYLDHRWIDRFGVDAIAERITADIEVGIGDTGIRAGIIGEVGADLWYISAAEERALRAAARAQKTTNVSISTHAARWPVGIPQLDLFEEEGVDLRRVIVGHCDTVNIPEYHEEIARRGAFVQFDTVRGGSATTEYDLAMRVGFVLNLVAKGLEHQLLLSHDICRRTHLQIHGGGGYDFIHTSFRQALLDAGLSVEQLDRILLDNPRRALTGAAVSAL